MSFSNSKLDSFVQEVLQGNGLNKSASAGYAPPAENNQSVVDAVNKAYSHLTQEEVSMADTLGFMEAANTVKQANYINEQIGVTQMGKSAYVHAGAKKLGQATADALYRGYSKVEKTPEMLGDAMNAIASHPHAVGYGVAGAGAAGLAGVGLLGHKMIRQRQAVQKAKLEQSIGSKVLSHLGRHAGKYALGAGVAGLGALALSQKAASQDELMDQAAEIGEQFIQKLASQAYENALVTELQLFREAAIDDVNAQQSYGY